MGALRLVLARTLVTGKIIAYLNFLLAKRDFGDDLETRSLIRLRVFQVFRFEDVFVFFAVMTWSVVVSGWWGAGGVEPGTCWPSYRQGTRREHTISTWSRWKGKIMKVRHTSCGVFSV